MNEVMEQPKVEEVKQEIQVYVQRTPPMTVSNAAECDAAKVKILEVRKEIKLRSKWFDENLLAHSKKTLDAAKAGHEKNKTIKEEAVKPLKDWDVQTDANIIAWTRKEIARVAALQAKANAKDEENRRKDAEKGKDPDRRPPPPVYQAPAKSTKSEAGTYTVKVNKRLVIYDETQVPGYHQKINIGPYYKVELNEKVIEQVLRSGQEVPGARLEDDFGSSMRV
ncbi:MAG TPA: hypothetical protein PKZ24_10975 [Nitrospirales bacterium]|nr:hypothetical protein [Nitrospirales bacterium]